MEQSTDGENCKKFHARAAPTWPCKCPCRRTSGPCSNVLLAQTDGPSMRLEPQEQACKFGAFLFKLGDFFPDGSGLFTMGNWWKDKITNFFLRQPELDGWRVAEVYICATVVSLLT